jgi:hypothetical protein
VNDQVHIKFTDGIKENVAVKINTLNQITPGEEQAASSGEPQETNSQRPKPSRWTRTVATLGDAWKRVTPGKSNTYRGTGPFTKGKVGIEEAFKKIYEESLKVTKFDTLETKFRYVLENESLLERLKIIGRDSSEKVFGLRDKDKKNFIDLLKLFLEIKKQYNKSPDDIYKILDKYETRGKLKEVFRDLLLKSSEDNSSTVAQTIINPTNHTNELLGIISNLNPEGKKESILYAISKLQGELNILEKSNNTQRIKSFKNIIARLDALSKNKNKAKNEDLTQYKGLLEKLKNITLPDE